MLGGDGAKYGLNTCIKSSKNKLKPFKKFCHSNHWKLCGDESQRLNLVGTLGWWHRDVDLSLGLLRE